MVDYLDPELVEIRLTAHVRRGKYLVIIKNREVHLTHLLFQIFVALVKARRNSAQGYAWLYQELGFDGNALHVGVTRLRAAIDKALGKGAGKALISHVRKDVYVLETTGSAIRVDPEVEELAPDHLSSKLVTALLGSRSAII